MRHFSSLERKVRGVETRTVTSRHWYYSVTKLAMDSKNDHVGGQELESVFVRRVFLGRKGEVCVTVSRIFNFHVVHYCFRPKFFEVSSRVRVGRWKLFSSSKTRRVLVLIQTRIVCLRYKYSNVFILTRRCIVIFVNIGREKPDCGY